MSNIARQRRITFVDRAAQVSNVVRRANLPLTSGVGLAATISRRSKTTLLTAVGDTEKRLFGDSSTGHAPARIATRRQASLLTQLAAIETRARQLYLI